MVVGQILFPFWTGSSAPVPEEPSVSRVLMTWDTSPGFLRFVPFCSPRDSTGSQDNLGTLTCPSLSHPLWWQVGKGGSIQRISKCGLILLGCGAVAVPHEHKAGVQNSSVTQLQLELWIWILLEQGAGLL